MKRLLSAFALVGVLALSAAVRGDEDKAGPGDNKPPEGFKALFNGKDLTNWQGLVDVRQRSKLSPFLPIFQSTYSSKLP